MRWHRRWLRAQLRRASELRRSERGQASVMIGMMMMTFILFFCFVINTGMLVNAKINLQNAADLAAYAGAATQARLLTQISFLNYEMRRQYKKFLFRYYVMGSMAQERFPRDGGSGSGFTKYQFSPDGTLQLGVPMVCIIFNPADNFCHVPQLKSITIPDANPLDAIQSTLVNQLQQIEAIRQANCHKIGDTNLFALNNWLWNTDPNLDNVNALPGDQGGSASVLKGLILGLGLIPKEMLLWRRIKTLETYVNHQAEKAVTKTKVDSLVGSGAADPAAGERTAQAFYSAYYTLGNHTFNGDDVLMDELTPQSLLVLKDIKAQFDTYALKFPADGGGSNGASDCIPTPVAITLGNKIPFGVFKDPTILTYYAIRLKAKAKLMFNPFGSDLELKAYAAARPFGSRIGPALDDTGFTAEGKPTGVQMDAQASVHIVGKIPNLQIGGEGSGDSASKGWGTVQALAAYYSKFAPPATGGGSQQHLSSIGQDNIKLAVQAAMVPNPFEANVYDIPDDLNGTDPFVRYYDSQQQYAFWAPLFPPGGQNQDASAEIQSLLDDLMQDNGSDPNFAAFKQHIKQALSTYVGKLHSPQGGEDHEGFNVVRINNPVMSRVGADVGNGPPQPITGMPESIALTDHSKIRTSWNAPLSATFRPSGRVGYSVKFITFESLTTKKELTNDRDSWQNSMATDGEADGDIPFIKH